MIDVLTAELRAPIAEETAELYVGGTVFKTGPPADERPAHHPARPGRRPPAPPEEHDPPPPARPSAAPPARPSPGPGREVGR